MHYPPTPTENMVEIQGDGSGSRKDRSISEEKRACACTPTHPYLLPLSISNMMSYINDTKNEREMWRRGSR